MNTYWETSQCLYQWLLKYLISDTTAGFISLMEQFTPPTMRGEGDRKNDARFLNTLKYNPNIGSPVLRVVRVVTVPGMSVLWREYRVGADRTEGEWR